MKNSQYKIWMGLICIILGFMLALQFRTNNASGKIYTSSFEDLAKQIQVLTKQRDDLISKVSELQNTVDKYEKNFSNTSDAATKLKNELDNTKKLAGLTDVEGVGVVITLAPPNDIASAIPYGINSSSILSVVNELNAAGAEAISINEERYVSRTQIREAGAAIKINNSSFSPSKNFVIKAIGESKTLEAAFNLPDGVKDILKQEYGITMGISQQQNIKILKYNKFVDYKYVKEAR